MILARDPNLKEVNVSFEFAIEGEIFIINFVTEFPPRLY